jgi:hypothetical protein
LLLHFFNTTLLFLLQLCQPQFTLLHQILFRLHLSNHLFPLGFFLAEHLLIKVVSAFAAFIYFSLLMRHVLKFLGVLALQFPVVLDNSLFAELRHLLIYIVAKLLLIFLFLSNSFILSFPIILNMIIYNFLLAESSQVLNITLE